ncbi:methyltransferase, FxLD system [Glycomyces sp. NPDC047010]|uniref:methyltransferase, FxLD system n=1 Tax=Glycomyces sp. NPDC047010 TaxID=3155023 RepID=UPI0033FE6CA1
MSGHEMTAAVLRAAMCNQIERDFPHLSAPTLRVVRQVPRHVFVPDVDATTAYIDDAVVTRRDKAGRALSSISQPSMVALMLDLLDLRPGHRVLEIGAGTGYAAALIAELVGPTGQVTTIDIDPAVTDEAARNLDAAGYSRVAVTCADGALGDAAGAPWDRILVSVGAWEPAPEWAHQLAPGGRLVMPLDLGLVQRIVAFERAGHGLRSTRVLAGGFLAQRGRDAVPNTTSALGEAVAIDTASGAGHDPGGVLAVLESAPVGVWTGVHLPPPGQYDRLIVYLALHHQHHLAALTGPRTFLPAALRAWGRIYATVREGTIAHLVFRPSTGTGLDGHHEVGVLAYGANAADAAAALAEDVREWELVRDLDPVFEVVFRAGTAVPQPESGVVLEKRHSHIRASWPGTPGAQVRGAGAA